MNTDVVARGHCIGVSGDASIGGAISLLLWVYGVAAGLSVYVFMGWLQTLLMLIGIAKNTAEDDILSRF